MNFKKSFFRHSYFNNFDVELSKNIAQRKESIKFQKTMLK